MAIAAESSTTVPRHVPAPCAKARAGSALSSATRMKPGSPTQCVIFASTTRDIDWAPTVQAPPCTIISTGARLGAPGRKTSMRWRGWLP